MIYCWHIPIMGFTQDSSRESGVEKLWRKLRDSKAVGPESSLVHPQRWRSDWPALAEFIWRNSADGAEVYVYAYSWGAGSGVLSLAKQLRKRGILVRHAVLCDPVFYQWFRLWRGLFYGSLNPPIVIPSNVMVVDSFYQRQNTPQAADLVPASAGTTIHNAVKLESSHQYIDDHPAFHELALKVANASQGIYISERG